MTLEYEQSLWSQSLTPVGVDEAGRGALAGPVVAAAVVLHPAAIPIGVNDSKKLTANVRASLRAEIIRSAVCWAVGIVDAKRIDEINILQATYAAMIEAIDKCVQSMPCEMGKPHLLVDGNRFPPYHVPVTTLVKGDARSPSIAAASIIAKTTRDAIMSEELHPRFPQYGFDVHKGYGTLMHRKAILDHGVSMVHRRSFLNNILASGGRNALDL